MTHYTHSDIAPMVALGFKVKRHDCGFYIIEPNEDEAAITGRDGREYWDTEEEAWSNIATSLNSKL